MSGLREQIISEAKCLLIQQGYHGFSMRQIAEALDVSKAALYYHFKDKEEILLAILDKYLDDIESIIDQVLMEGGACHQQIQQLLVRILSQPDEQRSVFRLCSQEMVHLSLSARMNFNQAFHQKFIHKIRALLQGGMQAGDLLAINPNIATWSLLGMMYPYFYPVHANEVPPPDEVAEILAHLFLDGLANREETT